jgi:hypothetical protein
MFYRSSEIAAKHGTYMSQSSDYCSARTREPRGECAGGCGRKIVAFNGFDGL